MSRDPYDDYRYDDRPAGDDRPPDRAARQVAAARRATALPGLLLILSGLAGLLLAGLSAVFVFNPDMMVRQFRAYAAQQPPGPERQDLEQKIDDLENQINQDRARWVVSGAVQLGVLALANLLAVVGGFAMRGLGSYGLSLAGAVVSLVPLLTGCCCTNTVFGLWALVVLLGTDVKDGFAARRRASAAPDPY